MGELELRISDLDRERAAATLNTAVSEGRLTWAEHEDRLSAVYAARTARELAPLLADLPNLATGRSTTVAMATGAIAPPLIVTLGKVRRRPDATIGTQQVDVQLGAAVLDLRDLPVGTVIDVIANSKLGKVEIFVSPGTRLIDTGTAWLGKRSTVTGWTRRRRGHHSTQRERTENLATKEPGFQCTPRRRHQQASPLGPDWPVVRVSGRSVLGHVRITVG